MQHVNAEDFSFAGVHKSKAFGLKLGVADYFDGTFFSKYARYSWERFCEKAKNAESIYEMDFQVA